MSRDDLEAALERLRRNLEDLEETVQFNLLFSSAHIGSKEAKRDRESIEELKEEVRRIEALLTRACG